MSPLNRMYVLDTNVLSELAKKRPNRTVVDWIASEPAARSIPFGAVIEIERGVVNLIDRNNSGAHQLSEWLGALLASDIVFLPMDPDTARLYGRMTMVPALRDLWFPSSPPEKWKLGQDLSIAAVAITQGAPVATMNVKDFLRIDKYFPLPGLYNPALSEWRIRPRALQSSAKLGNVEKAKRSRQYGAMVSQPFAGITAPTRATTIQRDVDMLVTWLAGRTCRSRSGPAPTSDRAS